MAFARHAIFRAAHFEAGVFTSCLSETLDDADRPFTPLNPELIGGVEVTRAQNRNYALAEEFRRATREGSTWTLCVFLQQTGQYGPSSFSSSRTFQTAPS